MANNQPENPELRKFRHEYIDRRWFQLYSLEKETGERALKYLFLTNSGGAVAVLSFLGNSEKARTSIGAWIALFLFGLGVILVGIFHAWHYHRMFGLFESWKKSAREFFSGKIDWDTLIQEDNKRSAPPKTGFVLGYGAFAVFIAGCIVGIISFYK
jgi:hypothetical protein